MQDAAVLHELTPVAEQLLERHLESAIEWFPHEVVPWERGNELRERGFGYRRDSVAPGVRSALMVNLLTEDNLPWYSRTLSRIFGSDSAWGEWGRRWTAEEGRHSIAMRDYVTISGLVDPSELEHARMAQVSSGVVPEPENAVDGMCYVAVQELATRVSHRNTGAALEDPAGYEVMMRLAADENKHHLFYRDLVSSLFKLNPSRAMESLSNQIRSFAMPGTGIPGFSEHARQIANEGIYDLSVHHDRIIEPLVTKQWAVDKVQGLSAAAEQARESLLKHVERLGKVANRMRERRQESAE